MITHIEILLCLPKLHSSFGALRTWMMPQCWSLCADPSKYLQAFHRPPLIYKNNINVHTPFLELIQTLLNIFKILEMLLCSVYQIPGIDLLGDTQHNFHRLYPSDTQQNGITWYTSLNLHLLNKWQYFTKNTSFGKSPWIDLVCDTQHNGIWYNTCPWLQYPSY